MNWLDIFTKALNILSAATPIVISQLHGGAKNTATEVGNALAIVNQVTTNLSTGLHPATGLDQLAKA